MIQAEEKALRRDEKGRPIAADGYPLTGLASVAEVVAATGLSRSQIYAMIQRGDLATKRFGRSVRVPWQLLRDDGILGDAVTG
jgi:excisionase family DNA binding protein